MGTIPDADAAQSARYGNCGAVLHQKSLAVVGQQLPVHPDEAADHRQADHAAMTMPGTILSQLGIRTRPSRA